MKVLVDTSVWSLAFRRDSKSAAHREAIDNLAELIKDLRTVMIGPIRQELLSGIVVENKFLQLREQLRVFDDEPIDRAHYELAAQFYNRCRKHGIQGSHVDFLICAVGARNQYPIFTLDQDFARYREHLGIRLYQA